MLAPRLFIDALKAGGAAWVMMHAFANESLRLGESVTVPGWVLVVALIATAYVVHLLWVSRGDEDVGVPPGLAIGLAGGLAEPVVAVPALVLALASALAMRSVHGFCVVGAGVAVAVAMAMDRGIGAAVAGASAYALPSILALMLLRRLGLLTPRVVRRERSTREIELRTPRTAARD